VSKKRSEELEVLRKNKLRRGSEREFFNREEPFKIPQINEQDPFQGSGIIPDREIWESCMKVSLGVLRHSEYSEV
jgi:hypothetical protein